jgi:hypothetical protein
MVLLCWFPTQVPLAIIRTRGCLTPLVGRIGDAYGMFNFHMPCFTVWLLDIQTIKHCHERTHPGNVPTNVVTVTNYQFLKSHAEKNGVPRTFNLCHGMNIEASVMPTCVQLYST